MVKTTKSYWMKSLIFGALFFLAFSQFPKTSATEVIFNSQNVAHAAIVASYAPPILPKGPAGPFLKIDSIGLNIPLYQTSLDRSGHLMVPTNASHAAWYKLGPKIGDSGTAIITGHLNWAGGNGVFINLRKVQIGDLIQSRSA